MMSPLLCMTMLCVYLQSYVLYVVPVADVICKDIVGIIFTNFQRKEGVICTHIKRLQTGMD